MSSLKANRLSKDYINTLPIIRFEGEVVVVDRPELEDAVIDKLKMETLIGFDTESKPSFKKGESHPVSLVQLATHDTAYLFQLRKLGFSPGLMEVLSDPRIKKIGVGLANDLEKLKQLKPFNAGGFVDLSTIAADKGIIQTGVRSLTARYVGHRLVKSAQKTNWAKANLTRKQQYYAACDAWICLKIYPPLLADAVDYRKLAEEELKRKVKSEA